jgi:hypothetical protein
MSVLEVSDIPLDGGRHRVEVTWRQDEAAARAVVATFTYQVDALDAEKIRWYLEDYPEFPADPAPALAKGAETRLAQIGADLFRKAFAGQDAAGIWGQAQPLLSGARVEVDTDPAMPRGCRGS